LVKKPGTKVSGFCFEKPLRAAIPGFVLPREQKIDVIEPGVWREAAGV